MKNLLDIYPSNGTYFKKEEEQIFCFVKNKGIIFSQNLQEGEEVIIPNDKAIIEEATMLHLKIFTLSEYPEMFKEVQDILPEVFNIKSSLVQYIKEISSWFIKDKAYHLIYFNKEGKHYYYLFNSNGSKVLSFLSRSSVIEKNKAIRLVYKELLYKEVN